MFRKDFVWGCASSAFQIEGASTEDGKGVSIWDVFAGKPGKILNGAKPDPSCDFYHRYKEDIAIMKQMGVQAYRFSLSWTRILPEGIGKVNQKGIDFYNNVINELLKNDIEPYITLYHWDYPQALQEKGGWLNEDSIDWFAEYASVVSENFSDRVKYFITLNEPQCFTGISALHGTHAPGTILEQKDIFQLVHNALRAHGKATIALRAHAKQKIKVGYAPTCGIPYPNTESPEDIEAARKVLFTCPDDLSNWTWNVPWFSDPVFLGKYPEDGLNKYKEYLPSITAEDMELIHQPLDFMGENIYNGYAIEAGKDGNPSYVDRAPGFPETGNMWPITPDCFRWGLRFLYERYKMPIYVTENGYCSKDVIQSDGRVHDPQRIDFLNRYILAMKKAIEDGADIRGYFEWTLTDNYEWNFGYRDRFGLVYVDFTTLRRIRKDSSYWYENVIKSNGDSLQVPKEILFFNPEFKQMIWGGNKMKDVYGYNIPGDKTGECWAVSAHPNGDCTVKGGSFHNKKLSELWVEQPQLFGNYHSDRFPLLLKVIDAKENLSIQVHPFDEYAKIHENGSLGKTECWYILDCDPNATLVVGHHAKTKEELNRMIDEQKWSEFIAEVPVKKGDFIQIDPGTVHAIKGGIMILETQQNSDITYRVYDYDRLMDGKPRQLHLQQSKDVITVPATANAVKTTSNQTAIQELVNCDYYTVWKYVVGESVHITQSHPFMIMSVIEGFGTVNGMSVIKGDHFVLPYNYGDILLEGDMSIIASAPAVK